MIYLNLKNIQMRQILNLLIILTVLTLRGQLIPAGSQWKYLDDGSNQGSAWQLLSYDDTSWMQGNAQLGYGDGDETTLISYGSNANNKHLTYYFRKILTVSNPNQKPNIKISLLRDDGAVVYINGNEAVRSNMPQGSIDYLTTALHTVAGADENTFFEYIVPASYLVQGDNIIAVEVHQRSHTSSDCSFDLSMEFTDEQNELFHKAPYLIYPGNNTEMIILWQLDDTGNCLFEWGTDTNYSIGSQNTTEYGNDHQHKINLTGLQPGTKYYYRVSYNGSLKEGSFYTGADDNQTQVSFYAYGDTRSQPAQHDLVAAGILNAISNDPASQTFIVNSGDLVYNGNSEQDWDSQFFSADYSNIRNMLSELPYLAAIGNHEGNGVLFEKYFPYPSYQNNRYYFSFDYGNAHITVVDQFVDYTAGSTQYTWLENDLAASDKPWKFIFLHKPGWSAGGHSNEYDVQYHIQPLCETYGVQFVINGHNHYYSRAVVNGVQHITTGGGGAPLYSPVSSRPNVVTTDRSYHFCKIDINDGSLIFTAIRADGTIIESVNLTNAAIPENHKDIAIKISNQNETVHFFNQEKKNVKLEVFDNWGQLVLVRELKPGNNILTLKTGVYFFRLTNTKNQTKVVKFLVE
jgi:hypothetical protein